LLRRICNKGVKSLTIKK